MGMNTNEKETLDSLLNELSVRRGALDAIEADWKLHRAATRRITCLLITEHGYSILKASTVSGHQRSTIMAWLAASGIQGRR